jgi:hypothetical protein
VTIRRTLVVIVTATVGFVGGGVATLAVQHPAAGALLRAIPHEAAPSTTPETADTFLAWTPGGLPAGFRRSIRTVPGISRSVVVKSDDTWLTRSVSAQGEVVDDPHAGFAIPLEVAAVRSADYAPFLPPVDRGVIADLARGFGILGESSARLRGLGPGAVLWFGDARVPVAAVLPDELVGANELLVSLRVGRDLGVTHDRYALIQPQGEPTERALARSIRGTLPAGLPVQVRAPDTTPYFRQGDAVLPPVQVKLLFGEFAAKPAPGRPGYLVIDPAWERTHIATEHVPLLGDVTCNVALFPQIRGAMSELRRLGLEGTITSYSGCYARRFTNRDPSQAISHHAWGIALDVNVPQNPFGQPPHQDPRLVQVMERWGFIWGGTFVRPDGMHFEYRRPPESP